jgi:beta-glucanase (GH16 family)
MRLFSMMLSALLLSSAAQQRASDAQWVLAWSDEFNGADGSSPDAAKWVFDIGGGGWGNRELESYTSRPVNAKQLDGNLVITAAKEDYTGLDNLARPYTSARLKTLGTFSQTYGRFEARMQLPLGRGIWSAFWMLGVDTSANGWPKAGEIDIMENIGEAGVIYSTLHGPGYSGSKGISQKFVLPAGEAVDTGFHVYAVEWTPDSLKFFFDDTLIVERTPKDLPQAASWVYNHPFFLLLNVAVGGALPGNPDAATTFPQKMLVDYVRVYSKRGERPPRS